MIFDTVYYYFIIFGISIGIMLGIISAYMITKRWSMLGDIISHAALPGIVIMFYFTHITFLPLLLLGGNISALISILFSFYLQKYGKFPKDSSFALLLSWFFSLGIMILNIVQRKNIVGQSILNNFIFGNILMINYNFIHYYALYTVVLLILGILTLKRQEFFSFDRSFSILKFKYVELWETLFLLISVLTIIIGLQAIGILLIGGLIILPGSIARLFAKSYKQLFFLSILFSIISFCVGIHITFCFRYLPTGPLCLLVSSFLFFSLFAIKQIYKKG